MKLVYNFRNRIRRSDMKKQAAILGIVALLSPEAAYGQMHVDDSQDLLPYTLVYADSSGTSHFEDASYPTSSFDVGHGVKAAASGPIAGDGIQLFCFDPGTVVDWHPAPRPQLYLILRGALDLEVSDGEVRRFRGGDLIVAEATEGKGVRAVWNGEKQSCVGVMPLRNR